MPAWLEILIAVVALVAPGIAGYVGVKVGLASLSERVKAAEHEIVLLRTSKHEHAQFLTRHELDLEYLKLKIK
jgi:hypothetical protein